MNKTRKERAQPDEKNKKKTKKGRTERTRLGEIKLPHVRLDGRHPLAAAPVDATERVFRVV